MESKKNDYTSLKIDIEDKVLTLTLNRPKSLNSLSLQLFLELKSFFDTFSEKVLKENDVRCVILKGSNGNFSSGLDLKSEIVQSFGGNDDLDTGRKAFWISNMIQTLQECVSSIEKCPLPVIAAIEGYCLGGATSLITCCDMRFCTDNSVFSIKEIEIGLTADIGVLQRMGRLVGNNSTFKKVSFTGENFNGKAAYELGLVSQSFKSSNEMNDYVNNLAKLISSKSPIVLYGIKKTIDFARDNSINSSLEMIKYLNSAMIQSEDIVKAVSATLSKTKPLFSKF